MSLLGIMYYANGGKYEGNWNKGKRDGEGNFHKK